MQASSVISKILIRPAPYIQEREAAVLNKLESFE